MTPQSPIATKPKPYDIESLDLATVDGRMALLTHIVKSCVGGWTKQTATNSGFVVETTEYSYGDAIKAIALADKIMQDAPREQKPIVVTFMRGLPRADELQPLADLEPVELEEGLEDGWV